MYRVRKQGLVTNSASHHNGVALRGIHKWWSYYGFFNPLPSMSEFCMIFLILMSEFQLPPWIRTSFMDAPLVHYPWQYCWVPNERSYNTLKTYLLTDNTLNDHLLELDMFFRGRARLSGQESCLEIRHKNGCTFQQWKWNGAFVSSFQIVVHSVLRRF